MVNSMALLFSSIAILSSYLLKPIQQLSHFPIVFAGRRKETFESYARNQSAETRPQHLRRRER